MSTRQEKINNLKAEIEGLKDYYEQINADTQAAKDKSFLGGRYHILGQTLILIDQLTIRLKALKLAEEEGWPWFTP